MSLVWAILFLSGSLPGGEKAPANALFNDLIDHGIPLPNASAHKLPSPLFREGMDKEARDAALAKAAGRAPVELFVKQSDNAPFTLRIDSINDKEEKRCGQTLDLWYVVYGKLSAVEKKDFLNLLIMGERKKDRLKESELLNERQLQQRNIKLLSVKDVEERYTTMELPLLDKVIVTGVTHTVRTSTPHSLLMATKLDDRFKNDKEFPNQWRGLLPQAEKTDALEPAKPYSGLMGYVSVVELPEPEGALLIELHFAFHEPQDWFGGPNLLRSKLPIAVQDNVRSFRRKLRQE